jgi:hypothetical protein
LTRCRLERVDHGRSDVRQVQEHGFDLGRLDAGTADLDLKVDPAEIFDLPQPR